MSVKPIRPPEPTGPPEWRIKLEARKARRRRWWARGVVLVLALAVGGFGYYLLSLPSTPEVQAPTPVTVAEMESVAAALAPTKNPARPVIAVVGINEGTETTDYLMPYGILKRADVADVFAVATQPGPIELFPAMRVEPDATIADFDSKYVNGADYVIVPAMSRDDDPDVLRWIRTQAEKGAVVIGVCAGAMVVANAGLLDGKRATTHWHFRDRLLEQHPTITPVRDRRFVVDDGVVTTTGISASMPMSLTLIQAIAGREKAVSVAADLGLTHWDSGHTSDAFLLTRKFAWTVMRNEAAFWKHEELGLPLKTGVDEVSLALVADTWSRTHRSQAVSFAETSGPVTTRSGLRILPDRVSTNWPGTQLDPYWEQPAAVALDGALTGIGARYGTSTRRLVEMQLEYSPPGQ